MAEVEVTEEDTVDRRNWRKKIRCGDPWWEKPKEEEEGVVHNCQHLPISTESTNLGGGGGGEGASVLFLKCWSICGTYQQINASKM